MSSFLSLPSNAAIVSAAALIFSFSTCIVDSLGRLRSVCAG